MSEMALTASRKARLAVHGRSRRPRRPGRHGPARNPTKFLSTVQIGITSIGVLNGIVGEAAFSKPLADWLLTVLAMLSERVADIRHRRWWC
jgi:putative hemolysin